MYKDINNKSILTVNLNFIFYYNKILRKNLTKSF